MARALDPCRIDLDCVAFFISNAAPVSAGENVMAGNPVIFTLPVFVEVIVNRARFALGLIRLRWLVRLENTQPRHD